MKARFLVMGAALLLAIVLVWGGTAWADQAAPVDPSVLTELDGRRRQRPVIVYATPGHLGDLTAEFDPATIDDSLALIGAVSTDVTSDTIDDVAALPYVDYIAADVPTFGTDYTASLDATNATIGLGNITSPTAGGLDGTGVGVAVLDSGTADVPDLDGARGRSRVLGLRRLRQRPALLYDDGGHGTFVAGIIAGNGSSSLPTDQGGKATTQYRGVAPNANIISLKVLDSRGQGRASSMIAAIAWAIAHRQQYNIRVMNISVEGDVTAPAAYDPLDRAVDAAWRAGIVVVCAAGNEGAFGEGGVLSPGNDPLRHHGRRVRLAADRRHERRRRLFLQLGRPDPLRRVRQARPGRPRQPHRLPARSRAAGSTGNFPQTRVAVSTYQPGASNRATPLRTPSCRAPARRLRSSPAPRPS